MILFSVPHSPKFILGSVHSDFTFLGIWASLLDMEMNLTGFDFPGSLLELP